MMTFYKEEHTERRARRIDMMVEFLQMGCPDLRERMVNELFANKNVGREAYSLFRAELMALIGKNEHLWRLIRAKMLAEGHRAEFAKLKPFSPWAVAKKMRRARRP